MKLCADVKPNAGCISMKAGASEWGLERGECEDLYDLKTASTPLRTWNRETKCVRNNR